MKLDEKLPNVLFHLTTIRSMSILIYTNFFPHSNTCQNFIASICVQTYHISSTQLCLLCQPQNLFFQSKSARLEKTGIKYVWLRIKSRFLWKNNVSYKKYTSINFYFNKFAFIEFINRSFFFEPSKIHSILFSYKLELIACYIHDNDKVKNETYGTESLLQRK